MSEDVTLDDFKEDSKSQKEWKTIQLGNNSYFTRYSGDTPTKSNSDYWGGEILWLSNGEVKDGNINIIFDTKESITESGLDNCTAKIVPEKSVMLSCTASIGKVAINQKKMATNQQFNSFGIKKGFNSYYLANKLLSMKEKLETLGGSTTHNHLSVYLLDKVEIEKPSLTEQRKIATVLYTVDQAIERTENIIEQVRTVKQGILQDLMNGEGSDRRLEEKRVGPRIVSLPEDWEVVQIGDAMERGIIFEQQDGNHGSDYPRKNEFVDEGIPYLSAEMLSEGEVDFSQSKHLTEERANQLRIGFAEDSDVLLAHNATVGPAGLLKTNRDFVIIGTSLTYYRCNPDKLDSQYLTYFFQSGAFQKQLQDVMRQSTRNQVPITRQRNLHLILPPIQQQIEISNQIDTVIEKLRTEKKYQERLQNLKQGLMQDLLSGTVRTTDANIQVPDEVAQYG